jgi:hemolysin III
MAEGAELTTRSTRVQAPREEIANSMIHGLALLAAIGAAPLLVIAAARGRAADVVGAAVFAATMVLLYFSSTLYHALPAGRAKALCRKLDHGAIFLFIAGSYTPFALGILHGPWGWTLFGLSWSLAVAGVLLKVFNRLSRPWLSTGLYLGSGWLVVIAAVPLFERMPANGIAWLVAGGLAYSGGVVFYALDSRIRYAHSVWHAFVVTGTACHLMAVMFYAVSARA